VKEPECSKEQDDGAEGKGGRAWTMTWDQILATPIHKTKGTVGDSLCTGGKITLRGKCQKGSGSQTPYFTLERNGEEPETHATNKTRGEKKPREEPGKGEFFNHHVRRGKQSETIPATTTGGGNLVNRKKINQPVSAEKGEGVFVTSKA